MGLEYGARCCFSHSDRKSQLFVKLLGAPLASPSELRQMCGRCLNLGQPSALQRLTLPENDWKNSGLQADSKDTCVHGGIFAHPDD
jgi:hypothetical protein